MIGQKKDCRRKNYNVDGLFEDLGLLKKMKTRYLIARHGRNKESQLNLYFQDWAVLIVHRYNRHQNMRRAGQGHAIEVGVADVERQAVSSWAAATGSLSLSSSSGILIGQSVRSWVIPQQQ